VYLFKVIFKLCRAKFFRSSFNAWWLWFNFWRGGKI